MLIISPKASDMMKYELEKAVVKGRVGANSKPVMRLAILEGKFHMGIDTEDFIQETDDIIMLNGIKVVMTKETSLLLDESTLDFYETDEVRGFGLDQIGKREEEDDNESVE
jgi:Fe-S cluster assembly iron-binding protein IscA